jgi:uncharacterized protein YbbK (DUF523 family)
MFSVVFFALENRMKPRILISKCLTGERCRYDGNIVPSPIVEKILPLVEVVSVCPEMDIGMSCPRLPIVIVENDPQDKLIQLETHLDLTEKMVDFSKDHVDSLENIDGIILKSKSPSCGVGTTKIFADADDENEIYRGTGLFAREILKKFKDIPITDEQKLEDSEISEKFLKDINKNLAFRTLN